MYLLIYYQCGAELLNMTIVFPDDFDTEIVLFVFSYMLKHRVSNFYSPPMSCQIFIQLVNSTDNNEIRIKI